MSTVFVVIFIHICYGASYIEVFTHVLKNSFKIEKKKFSEQKKKQVSTLV